MSAAMTSIRSVWRESMPVNERSMHVSWPAGKILSCLIRTIGCHARFDTPVATGWECLRSSSERRKICDSLVGVREGRDLPW
jgi:hypothetical protein